MDKGDAANYGGENKQEIFEVKRFSLPKFHSLNLLTSKLLAAKY